MVILPWFSKTDSRRIRNIKFRKVHRLSNENITIFCDLPGICFSRKEDHRSPRDQKWSRDITCIFGIFLCIHPDDFKATTNNVQQKCIYLIKTYSTWIQNHMVFWIWIFRWNEIKKHRHTWIQNCQNLRNDPAWQMILFASGGKHSLGHGDPPETWRPNKESFSNQFPFMYMFDQDSMFCAIPKTEFSWFVSNRTRHGTCSVANALNNCNNHAHFTSTTIHTVAMPNSVYNFTTRGHVLTYLEHVEPLSNSPKTSNLSQKLRRVQKWQKRNLAEKLVIECDCWKNIIMHITKTSKFTYTCNADNK